ncbi:DUF6332 family protein [Streptomyces sp. NPDC048419]|uniref:DUF6332 family protein n=1 Tax=Streptomyces sp. NPDC048419 TaxID=3365547 RepID=UPI0037160626
MTDSGGRRNKAERDALTVEVGYALSSAAFAGLVLYGAIAGPALLFELPHLAESLLRLVALVLAPVLFAVRVVSVLVRYRRTGQPNQPGRTRPDS